MLGKVVEAVYHTPRNTLLTHVPETKGTRFYCGAQDPEIQAKLQGDVTLVLFEPADTLGLKEAVVGKDVVWNL